MSGDHDGTHEDTAQRSGYESLVLGSIETGHNTATVWCLRTGQWADFAAGDKGGDVIALYAYLRNIRPGAAAREPSSRLLPQPQYFLLFP